MNKLSIRKTICKLLAIALVFVSCIFSSQFESLAATQNLYVSSNQLDSGLQFRFVGMPYNSTSATYSPITYNGSVVTVKPIQNFEFTPDGKYVFAASQCTTGSTLHTLLSRCSMPSDDELGADGLAYWEDSMVLGGYGHGEVLAITQDNLNKEVYNIWVGCSPESKSGRKHATKIRRITYSINANGKGVITKKVTITGFKKANVKKGKAAYFKNKVSPLWVIAAIDTSSNQIVFRLRFKSGYGCTYLSYNFKKLNAALNKVKNGGTYNIKKAAKWQMARVKCSQSIQSFDVCGKTLYMACGSLGGDATVYVLNYKTQKNKKLKDQKKTAKNYSKAIHITPQYTIDDVTYTKSQLELEAIKVKKNSSAKIEYYINFLHSGQGLRDTQAVHMFTL